MLIGEWVFDHDIDVIVEELCFSSCANYIFTAGNNKTIEAEAIVGWHGSHHQDEHLARGYGVSLEEIWAREYDENAESWGKPPPTSAKPNTSKTSKSTLRTRCYEKKSSWTILE